MLAASRGPTLVRARDRENVRHRPRPGPLTLVPTFHLRRQAPAAHRRHHELDARDIALHFGHQDGGELVRKLYGHPDAAIAREKIREAFRQGPPAPVPLTVRQVV